MTMSPATQDEAVEDIKIGQLVQTGLESIVEHYIQAIHHVEDNPPYFDSLLGRPVVVAPVIKFWIEKLEARSEADKHQRVRIAASIVQGYASDVRPVLFKNPSIRGVPVLQHFEIFLAQWLDVISETSTDQGTVSMSPEERQNILSVVCNAIEIIASDITLLTTPKKEQFSDYVRANIVLPTLLRITGQCVVVLSNAIHHNKTILHSKEIKRTLVRLALSLLSFQKFRLDPSLVAKSLTSNKKSCTSTVYPLLESVCSCTPSPEEFERKVDPKHLQQYLTPAGYNWNTVALQSSASWNDPVTGLAKRTTIFVWNHLCDFVGLRNNEEMGTDQDDFDRLRSIILDGICSGEMGLFVKAIRAHFFGRDMHMTDENQKSSTRTQIVLGRRVAVEKPQFETDKPHEEIVSRIYSVLNACSLLKEFSGGDDDSFETRSVLEELLPVSYALIDSPNKSYIALGCACLIHLLDISPPEINASEQFVWDEFVDSTLSVLNLAFKTCREGPVVLLLGQAQTRLFVVARNCSKARRQTSRQWLSSMYQSVHRPSSESLCWELLVGGVIPLLRQQAELNNADAMELGRLGLSAILPSIASDILVVDQKIQIAALVALINLMMGAYPILPLHGGKIMVSLLVAASNGTGETEQESSDNEVVVLLAKHAAAVALVLCGAKGRAIESLEQVISDEHSYENRLVKAVYDIKSRSTFLKHQKKTESVFC